MSTRADLLAQRRLALIAESQAQRADLAQQMLPLTYTLSSVHIGLRILDRIRKHPGWIAVVTVALAAITPRRLSSVLQLGTAGLRLWRLAMPLVQSRFYR